VLAVCSARAGRGTLLVDADPWLDVQRVWLGLPPGPSLTEVAELGAEAIVRTVHGDLELASFAGPEVVDRSHRALVRRVPEVFESRDAVVVDAGSRLEAVDRCVDLRVGSVVIVSTPDAIGLASTHALLKAFRTRAEIEPVVLLNRVSRTEAELAAAVLSEGAGRFLGAPPTVVGGLPTDPLLVSGLGDGAMLAESLVASPLPDRMAAVMPDLLPWAAA
jgi:MinD-like ATPase involved in chromosome partitioning or flagellar assembly